MFIMPLVNIQKIKNRITRFFRRQTGEIKEKLNSNNIEFTCGICQRNPILVPYTTNCSHLFCYSCLKLNCTLDDTFACPLCGTQILQMKIYEPY